MAQVLYISIVIAVVFASCYSNSLEEKIDKLVMSVSELEDKCSFIDLVLVKKSRCMILTASQDIILLLMVTMI